MVGVRLEKSGQCTDENLLFVDIIEKCGQELQDIGLFLQENASEIRDAHQQFLKEQATSKAHKHKVHFPPIKPITDEIISDDDCIAIPKPLDDDCNRFHDKSDPLILKLEAPDCSSAEEDETPVAFQIPSMPMGPVKPRK